MDRTVHQMVKDSGSAYLKIILAAKMLKLNGRQRDKFSARTWTEQEYQKIASAVNNAAN